jgi:hypothetical protein
MAVVHRSRGAGLVYGLGGYEQRSFGGGTGDSASDAVEFDGSLRGYGGGDGLSFLGSWFDGGGGYLGAIRGDIDPATGKVFDGSVWVTPNDGQSQTLSDAYKSYMTDPFATMTEAEKTAYWAGQGTQGLANVGYSLAQSGGVYDPAMSAAATAAYVAANQSLINTVTNKVQTAQTAATAATNAQYDYVARANGDLATWYALAYPGQPRYSTINGSIVDNALLAYQSSIYGGQNMASLAASAAQAQAAADDRYQYSLTHGGFSDAATNPNAKTVSQSLFGPVTTSGATTAGKTIGTTADGKTVVWNDAAGRWDPVAGSSAFAGANAGSAGASMPSAGGGDGGGGGYGGSIEAGGGGAVGALVAGMPGGWLGVLALVGAVVVSSRSSRGGRRRR